MRVGKTFGIGTSNAHDAPVRRFNLDGVPAGNVKGTSTLHWSDAPTQVEGGINQTDILNPVKRKPVPEQSRSEVPGQSSVIHANGETSECQTDKGKNYHLYPESYYSSRHPHQGTRNEDGDPHQEGEQRVANLRPFVSRSHE